MTLSSVDLRFLVYELKKEIIGSWIVNIYHLPNGVFIFKLRLPQEGTRFLLIEPGNRIHLTQFNRTMPKEPTPFCKTLRSHLRDRRINAFEQKDLDRMVEMVIGADDGRKLIIELFGDGNVILVASGSNKILGALRYKKMKDRDIHPGKIFRYAPPMARDILRHGTTGLEDFLKNNDKIVIALNEWMGLGPYYSRLVLKNSGVKAKLSADLKKTDIEKLVEKANNLLNRIEYFEYQPTVYLENTETQEDNLDGIIIDYDDQWNDDSLAFNPEKVLKIQPWPQSEIEDVDVLHVDKLNEALDIFYSSQEDQSNLSEEVEQIETEVDRLERRLSQQKEHQNNMFLESEIMKRNGDTLYLYYTEIDELLSTIYNARKNKTPWEEIISKLNIAKVRGMKSAQIIDEIKPNQAKVVVKLKNEDKEFKLPLDFRKSINDLANDFYTKSKRQLKRAKGADIAIKQTLDKIENAKLDISSQQKIVDQQVTVLKRRKRWYEKWHWMEAPNGIIIVGGKDATTNEQLVKKYLEDDDLFLHADISGAPFVVIKSENREVTEKTKEVAAVLGVCYSSAWKGKRASADAFIVNPDQVSLSAPSGEFLPKGSIMIYGTKEYIKDIHLELYIGLIIEQNWVRLISGPDHVKEKSDIWVKIKPGETPRGKVARAIKDGFGRMLDDKDRQKLLTIDTSEIANFIPDDSQIVEYSPDKLSKSDNT
jgi:predicted ribosome quality control (RQC) complex YloA/Tae2 family protein